MCAICAKRRGRCLMMARRRNSSYTYKAGLTGIARRGNARKGGEASSVQGFPRVIAHLPRIAICGVRYGFHSSYSCVPHINAHTAPIRLPRQIGILSDLRDSGDIEQNAELVAFIFRQELYEPHREHLRGLAELLIAKQRKGPTGLELTFIAEFKKFESRAGEVEDAT
jgi:hypothetical protein